MPDNDVYKQKTLDSALNTISEKMEAIFNDTDINKNKNRRRWVWELLQNASDCYDNKPVDVCINTTEKSVTFMHSGKCFSKENLIDLFTQISAKRTNEEKTGKFGTGFISTHLLATKVRIKGAYQSYDNKLRKLNILLDRSSQDYNELRNSISTALDNIDNLENNEEIGNDLYNTIFEYNYDDSEIRISKEEFQRACNEAYADWESTIPFVLAFSDKLGTVKFNNTIVNKKIVSSGSNHKIINIIFNSETDKCFKKITIRVEFQDSTSIACLLGINDDSNYYFNDISKYPKLFCAFPLIGTENFPFPIVINDSSFYVTKERDNVLINQECNIRILNTALSLYENLLNGAAGNHVEKGFNICQIIDDDLIDNELLNYKKKVQNLYFQAPIIKAVTPDDDESFYSMDDVLIPYYEQNPTDFWNLVHKTVNSPIPNETELINWKKICPKNGEKSVFTLSKFIDCIKNWGINSNTPLILNELYKLCWNPEKKDFNHKMIFLNQKNEFREYNTFFPLYYDDTDEELKEILCNLGGNVEEELISKNLVFYPVFESKKNNYIAEKISSKIREALTKENSHPNYSRDNEMQQIFNKLIIWFMKHPEEAKQLFPDIYEKQHLLCKPEDTIKKLEIANQVETAMENNNLSMDQLDSIISSIGELAQLLNEDKELPEEAKKLLKHITSHSPYSAQRVQEMIERSIGNVYDELKKNPKYSVSETLEEWKNGRASNTVFFAKKESNDIRIIVRPRDYNKVIFFEETEFDAVDDYEYELWTDDGKSVKQITLKDLLKTTGITCFPLKNLYK
ncbi:MAG: hypothetical protein MR836_04435 [Ruminococcus sp.]|nr:hypothetical protein [Ruminococcus sp.]